MFLERGIVLKKVVLLIVVSLFLCSCGQKQDSYKEIMAKNEYTIVDVRTEEEFLNSHIKEAINIPYDEIDENVHLDKEKIIFVYCRSGARSKTAYNTLKDLGYRAYDLGSMDTIDLERE